MKRVVTAIAVAILAYMTLSWIIPQDSPLVMIFGKTPTGINSTTKTSQPADGLQDDSQAPIKPSGLVDTSPLIKPYQNGYCYTQLSPSEQNNYQFLLNSLVYASGIPTTAEEEEEGYRVELPTAVMTKEDVHRLFYALHTDHPEIFYLREQYGYLHDGEKYIGLVFYYMYPYSERVVKAKEFRTEIDTILEGANALTSDFEKELFFRDAIAARCRYNDLAAQTYESNRPLYEQSSSAYAALCDGLPICGGYARGMQALLNAAGIQATTVVNDDHRWNMVWLDGEPYHLDITWDERFTGKQLNHYVNLTDDEISLSREYPVQLIPLPAAASTAHNYHRQKGHYFDSDTLDQAENSMIGQIRTRTDGRIELRFGALASLTFAQEYVSNGYIRDLAAQTEDAKLTALWSDYEYYHDKTLGTITIVPTGEA